jgi:hypothetical protein
MGGYVCQSVHPHISATKLPEQISMKFGIQGSKPTAAE